MYYFAYGSNMNPTQMINRCPSSKFVTTGHIQDHILNFPIFSRKRNSFVASIKPMPGHIVEGVVWEFVDDELPIMDRFESLGKNYDRVTMDITIPSGTINAVVYIAIIKDDSVEGTPSKEYLDTINEGKKYFYGNS